MTRYEKVFHVFFPSHLCESAIVLETTWCFILTTVGWHSSKKNTIICWNIWSMIHILCSLSFILGNSVRRWGWGWLDFCDTFVSYSICTTSSWSISDRKVHVWADILNAVYFRRGLTCTFGITNNLIHVDGGPPRAKNHFVFALHRWGLALWSWPLSIKLLVNPRLHIRPCLKLTAFNKSALYVT